MSGMDASELVRLFEWLLMLGIAVGVRNATRF
jgi:TRAP-type C4-dicarboxylate transport system permease small subunit